MSGVLKLVERQIAAWELRRRVEDLGQRAGRCLEENVAYGPCLLISRERGCGGERLARLAGERLGWHVFDREIVNEIAQLAHVRQQLIGSIDQRVRTIWEDDWRPELQPEDIGYETYLRCLRQVIRTLGHQGDVVILGRGAMYLLPSRCALRVRVVAPFQLRVEQIAEATVMPLKEAQALVHRIDGERAAFIRKNFGRDIGLLSEYDLVVNTGEITVEAATEIVLTGLRRKLGVHPSG